MITLLPDWAALMVVGVVIMLMGCDYLWRAGNLQLQGLSTSQ